MFTCSSPIVPLCFRYPATHPQSHLAQITPVIQQSPEEPGRERTNFIMLADGGGEDETEDQHTHTQQWREIPFSISLKSMDLHLLK